MTSTDLIEVISGKLTRARLSRAGEARRWT